MAGSGVVLVLFVLGHLVGNLQFFLPPEAINRYGHFLQSNLEVLWPVRLILLGLVTLHIFTAFQLWAENRAARPVAYASPATAYGSTLASRTMLVSGLVVASFIVFHLLHYTLKVEAVNGSAVPFHQLMEPGTGHPDVYAMMVAGFSVWYVAVFYVIGVGLLCWHLSHGLGAMLQSLGLRNPTYTPLVTKAARVIAVLLFVGYASLPASVLLFGHGRAYLAEVVTHHAKAATAANDGKEAGK
jgi:succinate dehydrogenase / fumarate reductase, cytochrome b subunit